MPIRRPLVLLCLAGALTALLLAPAAGQEARAPYDVRVFARIGMPGQPEGIAVGRDQTVYVGTHNYGKGDAEAPSKVFAFNPSGKPAGEYVIQGQAMDADHGILAMATDANGVLYVLDRNPSRILTLDPRTGAQRTYVTFDDVAPCAAGGTPGRCSAGAADLAPFPDYLVFGPDGTLYVTDLEQALIWRVPPGGGSAEVWFTDARLEGAFGPNGIQFAADGRTLVFAQTGSQPPGAAHLGQGVVYTLPVRADGGPGELTALWTGRPLDGPDGLAIAKSGNIWLALAGSSQIVVLSPAGEELARFPETPVHNQQQEIPFDAPGSLAFLGERVLVTNHSFFTATEANWAVLDVFAGEPGLPMFHPRIPSGTTGSPPAPDEGAGPGRAGLPATGPAVSPGLGAGLSLAAFALAAVRRRS